MNLPLVRVIVLGGTITMAPSQGGITPTLSGDDLIELIPDVEKVATLVVETPFLKPGASLELAEILELSTQIQTNGSNDYAGTVIVQGTDTIDETSYLLDILTNTPAPTVVTGAMRGATALSADGPANLMAAIRVAASPLARNLGVLVVLNDEIHAARSVEKSHKALLSSFISLQGGALGYVFEEQIRIVRRPNQRNAYLQPKRFGKVAVVKAGLGSDSDLLDALPSLNYEGVVVEGMGVGHVPANLVVPLQKLTRQMPVILTSRVSKGPVFTSTYGFPGSETDLFERGLLSAHWLTAHKARLLLATLIGADVARHELPLQLERYGQG